MGESVVDGRFIADGEYETDAVRMFAALGAERDRLRVELADARSKQASLLQRVVALQAELDQRQAAPRPVQLPVLCRDLKRWSTPPAAAVVVVPVGPPPLPPALDDLTAIDHEIAVLRRLVHTPMVPGKPFHTQFDLPRFQLLHAKLKEAGLLAERLISQVERSKNQKEMLWHLMVAQRTDELSRKRR